jgi:hypothetical protein
MNLENDENYIELVDMKLYTKSKNLFIMFQGSGTNLKSWNEHTESKFLDRLKKIGEVYVYQDKIYNTIYYDKSLTDHTNYDSDIDFDLSYVDLDKHIKIVYNDIIIKYKNINEYKLIPVGWSVGGYLALYFSQIYKHKCKMCILLDSCLITKKNIQLRLQKFREEKTKRIIYQITNNEYKTLLNNLKINNDDTWKNIIDTSNYLRTLFIDRNINIKFDIPVIAFLYINKPYKYEYNYEINNEIKIREAKILSQRNPTMYKSYILINSGHCVYNKIKYAKFIINKINEILK